MANKKQREEKRRMARMRTQATHDEAEEEINDAGELEELSKELEPVYDAVEKDYGDYASPMPMNGPTSWDEHEAMKAAREKAEAVREVTWTTQDLVSNILYANMTPEQKSKAIQAVGDGMGKKLKEVEKEDQMKKEVNLDLLELKSLIAKDARQMSVLEKADLWLSKFKPVNLSAEYTSKTQVRQALSQSVEMIEKGESVEVETLYNAAKKWGIGVSEKSTSDIMIKKDATGQYRAVMWPSNNFKDYDGEIISEKAHLEYVDWVNENMDIAPLFITWHKPGTMRKSRVDFVGYENGFLIASCQLTEKEAEGLLKAQTLTEIGMSHGSIVLERDPLDPNIITKYRMVEVSDLPLANAANPFTNLETLMKEAVMAKGKVSTKDYLATILGSDEEAEKFLTRTGIKQKELLDAGVDSKEKTEEAVVETPVVAQTVDIEKIAAQVFERVAKELDVDGLNDYLLSLQEKASKVDLLEQVVKDMAQSKEDKVAEMIEAPIAKTMVWKNMRASASKESVLGDQTEQDQELQKAKPELGWLSEVTRTQPVNA